MALSPIVKNVIKESSLSPRPCVGAGGGGIVELGPADEPDAAHAGGRGRVGAGDVHAGGTI